MTATCTDLASRVTNALTSSIVAASPPGPRPPRPTPREVTAQLAEQERAALSELAEVERAMAALEGRDTGSAAELAVARKDAEKRRAALEALVASTREELAGKKRVRLYKIAAGLLFVALLVGMGAAAAPYVRGHLAQRQRASEAADAAARPFLLRFSPGPSSVGAEPLVLQAAGGTCYVAVAASPDGVAHVRVERELGAADADLSVGWCSCASERVVVTPSGPGLPGVRVLSAAASKIGGADLLAAMAPKPGATIPEAIDRACAEAAFDAWADGHRPLAAKLAPRPEEQGLAAEGLELVAVGAGDVPFAVLPEAADSCFVVRSRVAGETLSLRRRGGERPLDAQRSALGFCVKSSAGLSVWHEGGGEIAVLCAPAPRLGGTLGLTDAAARARVALAVAVPSDDLEADARAALAASGVALSGPGAAERGAVVALSADARSTLAAADLGADIGCRPLPRLGAVQAMCVEGRPGALAALRLPIASATAPRPLWLPAPPATDRAELERALDVLAFARRMTARGFELTSLVGFAATPDGAAIQGQSGQKEIVAVSVSAAPPYLHTLSDGPAWTLAGEPRVVALAPRAQARLRATPPYVGAARREIVVWRR